MRAQLALCCLLAAGAARAAAEPAVPDEPVPLGTITVIAPPPNELEQSDRQLESVQQHLPELGNGRGAQPYRAPDYKSSVFARPEDLAGSVVYDVKAENARTDARAP
ncbi:MAG TPA: hypothetical protein VHE37_13895 [Nevskiaceae bacterium]|nr:hypothetical protein [Nevskiaceae bacterium]